MSTRVTGRGFTLIEVMIVVALVAVLAAISYPGYQDFVARAKRNEARAALLHIASSQERYYLDNRTFTTNLTALGLGTDARIFQTASGAYRVVINSADTANWDATATYLLGGREATRCRSLTINGAGIRGSAPERNCWNRTR